MNTGKLLPLFLCLGLAACTTTGQQPDSTKADSTTNSDITGVVKQSNDQVNKVDDPIFEGDASIEQPVVVKPVEPAPLPTKTEQGRLILGSLEWVYFPGFEKSVKARVDENASSSLVGVVDLVQFERNGNSWVKFSIESDGKVSDEISLPVLRWSRIQQADIAQAASNSEQRNPVISVWIQVGELKDEVQFTLIDRKYLSHPIVLGSNFYKDVAVVDSSRYLVQPRKE